MTTPWMRSTVAALAALTLLLAGCTQETAPGPQQTAATITPTAAGDTIETIWARFGCKEDDPAGSQGVIEAGKAPIELIGQCVAPSTNALVFYFQFPSEQEARDYVVSDPGLQLGSKEVAFLSGRVVMVASTITGIDLLTENFEDITP